MAESFDLGRELLVHLDAGYNLARWLVKNEQDARDVVQDAFVRALRFRGEVKNIKPWFLAIVRNAAYTSLQKKLPLAREEEFPALENEPSPQPSPEELTLQSASLESVRQALFSITEEYREIFVLREVEDLSYQELAELLEVPVGTVMSRLARARVKILECVRRGL